MREAAVWALVFNVVLFGAIFLAACSGKEEKARSHLLTVEHDGHRFVVAGEHPDYPKAILHHPDCPCGRRP